MISFLFRKNTWDAQPRLICMSSIIEVLESPLESVPWVPRERMAYALCSLCRSLPRFLWVQQRLNGAYVTFVVRYLSAFCSLLEICSIVSITKRNETLSHVCKAFVLLIVLVVIINNNQFPVCVWRKKNCFPSFRTWVRKAPWKTDSTKMEIFVMEMKLRGRPASPPPCRTCCAASPLLLLPLLLHFLSFFLFVSFAQFCLQCFPQKKNICAHLAEAHLHFIFTTHTVWQQLSKGGRVRMRVSVWESGEESAAQPMAGDSQLMIALQPHEGSRRCQSRSEVKRRPNQRAPTAFIVVADACVVSHISPFPSASLKFFLGDFVWFMSWPNNNNNHNTPSCVQLSPCNLNELPAPSLLSSLFPLFLPCLFATLKRLSPHCKAATAAADQAQINTL